MFCNSIFIKVYQVLWTYSPITLSCSPSPSARSLHFLTRPSTTLMLCVCVHDLHVRKKQQSFLSESLLLCSEHVNWFWDFHMGKPLNTWAHTHKPPLISLLPSVRFLFLWIVLLSCYITNMCPCTHICTHMHISVCTPKHANTNIALPVAFNFHIIYTFHLNSHLNLDSVYEKNIMFFFLNLDYFTSQLEFQDSPFFCKWPNFTLFLAD